MNKILLGLALAVSGIACGSTPNVFWLHKNQVIPSNEPVPSEAQFAASHAECKKKVLALPTPTAALRDLMFLMCMREELYALVEHIEPPKK